MTPRRRALTAALLAALAVVACKGKDDRRPTPAPGSAAPAPTGTGSAVPGSALPGIAHDLGSAMPAPGAPITRPFFYKVEKAGKTSYLLGTWHIGIDGEKQLPGPVWEAFAAAGTFAMEADPADPVMRTATRRDDGRTLEAELGSEYWAKLEALLGGAVPDGMKALNAMGATMLLQFKDLPQTPAMDLVFVTKARDARKQVVFLEPAAAQLRVLDKWIDARVLRATIDDLEGTKRKLEDAMGAYMLGDDAALATMVLDRDQMKLAGFTAAEVDQAAADLLYDRSRSWIPALSELFAKGGAFVAVGAGHLIGPRSVVELLAADGFTITRVGG